MVYYYFFIFLALFCHPVINIIEPDMASNHRIIPIDYSPNASSQINCRLKPCILIWYLHSFSQLKWPTTRNRLEVTLQSVCRPLLTNSHFNWYSLYKAMVHRWFIQGHQLNLPTLLASTQPNMCPLHIPEEHLVELWLKLEAKSKEGVAQNYRILHYPAVSLKRLWGTEP